MQGYALLRQIDSDFGHFNDRVCHVMKMTTAESDPDIRLLTQHTLCCSPDVLASPVNKMPIMTMSMSEGRRNFFSRVNSVLTRVARKKNLVILPKEQVAGDT